MIELTRFNKDPELVFDPSLIDIKVALKPQKSLWLSNENLKDDCQTSWCKAEGYLDNPRWMRPYRFKVTVDETKLICLDTLEKVKKFSKQYRVDTYERDMSPSEFHDYLNWPQISELCSGVLFSPYRTIYEEWGRASPIWYYCVDWASAAIWKEDAIVKIERS